MFHGQIELRCGYVAGGGSGTENRRPGMDGLPGYAAHDMDAELEPEAVHESRKGLEARAAPGGGEALRRGNEAGPGVHLQRDVFAVFRGFGAALVPLDVDDDVLPAQGPQLGGHVLGIGPHLVLEDGGSVAIPAVPAHGGRRRPARMTHAHCPIL